MVYNYSFSYRLALFSLLFLSALLFVSNASLFTQGTEKSGSSIDSESVDISPMSVDSTMKSSLNWVSLGFSRKEKFYAYASYGVEYNLKSRTSDFFVILKIIDYRGESEQLVFEKELRRKVPTQAQQSANTILFRLLRGEAATLERFDIDSLQQGRILMGKELLIASGRDNVIEETSTAGTAELVSSTGLPSSVSGLVSKVKTEEDLVGVAINELSKALKIQQSVKLEQETAVESALRQFSYYDPMNSMMIQIGNLKLQQQNLRGQVAIVDSVNFPHRYPFTVSWQSHLYKTRLDYQKLQVKPIMLGLAPDKEHLLLAFAISANSAADNPEQADENALPSDSMQTMSKIIASKLDSNSTYAYAVFSLQIY